MNLKVQGTSEEVKVPLQKVKVIASQNGPDDQDYEEVLLSDSEKFENIFDDDITERKDEDNIPY